jgi:surfeit locus 1 family protein
MRGFRPALGPTVLTLVAVLAFCTLGAWQVHRHYWRMEDLAAKSARSAQPAVSIAEAERDPETASFRRVDVRGRFELADTVLVGPVERGRALGARVLTPLRMEGAPPDAPRLLIDRGWAPQESLEQFLPPDAGESEIVDVEGLALPLALPLEETRPGSRSIRRTHFPRFNPDRPKLVAKLTDQLPYPLEPLMLQSVEPEPGGLPIGEPARPASPVDHRGYAFTWFSVALLSLAAWIEYGRRRARELGPA